MYTQLRTYIKNTWSALRRSPFDVANDPKVPDTVHNLYVPSCEDIAVVEAKIEERRKATGSQSKIKVKHLPDHFEDVRAHGILYLPHDYVVPGGRFNEMYGWDSYWIMKGLLRDDQTELARGIVENCFYQISHYGGKVLNGNRTYYDRAHPPVTALMISALLAYIPDHEKADFLTRGEKALYTNYFEFWRKQRFTETTGLFHYGSDEQGALGLCPEVVFGERDPATGESHYDKIVARLADLSADDPLRQKFYDRDKKSLTRFAIAGDRGMRESGFDTSMHLGFYGLETHIHNPICLNSLLYLHCEVAANMCEELGRHEDAARWNTERIRLRGEIRSRLWNEATGLFMALNTETGKVSEYPFLSSAYPLMAGIATQQEAERFREFFRSEFETEWGVQATPCKNGCQWELMWAPLVDILTSGLRRYKFFEDADRIEKKFLGTVHRVFQVHSAIFEKYDPSTGTSSTAAVEVGYEENVKGFGWTNAVVAEIIDRQGALT